jgi:hypothetical protein
MLAGCPATGRTADSESMRVTQRFLLKDSAASYLVEYP